MNFYSSSQKEQEMAKRIQRIVDLNCRRDKILLSPILDLEALEQLVADYEAADMPCAAAALRKRLAWYKSRVEKKRENGKGRKATLVRKLLGPPRVDRT